MWLTSSYILPPHSHLSFGIEITLPRGSFSLSEYFAQEHFGLEHAYSPWSPRKKIWSRTGNRIFPSFAARETKPNKASSAFSAFALFSNSVFLISLYDFAPSRHSLFSTTNASYLGKLSYSHSWAWLWLMSSCKLQRKTAFAKLLILLGNRWFNQTHKDR